MRRARASVARCCASRTRCAVSDKASAGESPSDDERLLSLADSVADGSSVDWASASSAHGGDDRDLLEQLKLIEAVAPPPPDGGPSPQEGKTPSGAGAGGRGGPPRVGGRGRRGA